MQRRRAEQKQGAEGGLAVEGPGVFGRGKAAAGAGEVGQGGAISAQTESMVRMLRRWGWSASAQPSAGLGRGRRGRGKGSRIGSQWRDCLPPIAVRLRWMEHPVFLVPILRQRAGIGLRVRRFRWIGRSVGLTCGGEVGEHAVAHLAGGFVGKGDGEDLLGLLDGGVGEQLEQALDEQAGLAQPAALDDEGAADVDCLATGIGVGRRGG